MKQQIRFCASFDGTRLAFALTGEGPPLVRAPHWLTHLEYEPESPVWRPWIEELSRHHRLVRMDGCAEAHRNRRIKGAVPFPQKDQHCVGRPNCHYCDV